MRERALTYTLESEVLVRAGVADMQDFITSEL